MGAPVNLAEINRLGFENTHADADGKRLGRVVEAATVRPAGDWQTTALPCGRRLGSRRCPGRLLVLDDGQGTIAWRCSGCGQDGAIVGWAGGDDDLRQVAAAADDPRRLAEDPRDLCVPLSSEHYAALLGVYLHSPSSAAIVARARVEGAHVVLRGSRFEVVDLCERLVACTVQPLDHPKPAARRRRRAVLRIADDVLCAALPRAEVLSPDRVGGGPPYRMYGEAVEPGRLCLLLVDDRSDRAERIAARAVEADYSVARVTSLRDLRRAFTAGRVTSGRRRRASPGLASHPLGAVTDGQRVGTLFSAAMTGGPIEAPSRDAQL